MIKNGRGQSGHRTLKLTVSQKWTDGVNWFFAFWYKFRKAESWLNDFWLGIKNWHGLLVRVTFRFNLWIELIFWMLIVKQQFLVTWISNPLTFKFQGSTSVVLMVLFASMKALWKWWKLLFILYLKKLFSFFKY